MVNLMEMYDDVSFLSIRACFKSLSCDGWFTDDWPEQHTTDVFVGIHPQCEYRQWAQRLEYLDSSHTMELSSNHLASSGLFSSTFLLLSFTSSLSCLVVQQDARVITYVRT